MLQGLLENSLAALENRSPEACDACQDKFSSIFIDLESCMLQGPNREPGLTYEREEQISFRNKSPNRKAKKPKQVK